MADAVFSVDDATGEVEPSPLSAGPRMPDAQHGGAVAALVLRMAGRIATLVPMDIARLTLDLMRVVPTKLLRVATAVVREGKDLQLVSVELYHEDVLVTSATVLKVRTKAHDLSEAIAPFIPTFSASLTGAAPTAPRSRRGFSALSSMRAEHGGFNEPGPAKLWLRTEGEVVAGEALTPAMQAVAAADVANGASSFLPFEDWTFVNADLTVNFARQPLTEWILVDATTVMADNGRAMTTSRLGDEQGWFGHATQTLFVQPRSPERHFMTHAGAGTPFRQISEPSE